MYRYRRRLPTLPKKLYFGHAGKAIAEEAKRIPGLGDVITFANDRGIEITEELPERPHKRQKTMAFARSIGTPRRRFTRPARRGTRKIRRKYVRRRLVRSRKKGNNLPLALRAQETKRVNNVITTFILNANEEKIVPLVNPPINQNPLNEGEFVGTASGKSIFSMGFMIWITVANVSELENYTFMFKLLEVHVNANAQLSGIYWDSSTGNRVPLQNLHLADRYKARTHVGQGFSMKKALAKTLNAKDAANAGHSEKSFKVWMPTMCKMHYQDSSFNKNWQMRFYCFKTNSESGTVAQVMNVRGDYVHYFKD